MAVKSSQGSSDQIYSCLSLYLWQLKAGRCWKVYWRLRLLQTMTRNKQADFLSFGSLLFGRVWIEINCLQFSDILTTYLVSVVYNVTTIYSEIWKIYRGGCVFDSKAEVGKQKSCEWLILIMFQETVFFSLQMHFSPINSQICYLY